MKKFTITGMLMLLGLFLISSGIHATNKESIFDDIVTVMERTTSAGNLPAIIDNAGATRGAGFNGRYVFVASRQNGDHVYYWDVTNPNAPVQELNISGVSGGNFTLADLTAVGNHVFASNMVMPGIFKIYHWNGISAQPSVLIEYNSGTARLGDAFTVMGDPDDFAMIIVSQHGGKSFYVWAMENGELDFDEPLIVTFDELPANVNFSRVTFPDGVDEFPIISGPAGVFVIGDDDDIILTIEQSFFPGWPMYTQVFTYEGGRYLAYMHVKDNPAANVMYILDITEGEDVLEALQILKNGTFAEKVLHSHDLGSIGNGNASVSMDVVIDSFGNLWLMGFAAGNGFVVQRIGDAGPDGLPLPFAETFDGEGEDTEDTWLPDGWISFTMDEDEDFNWYWSQGPTANPNGQMRSQSAYQDDGTWYALTPDNWLVTPKIYLNNIFGDEMVELTFKVGTGASTPAFKQENYSVLISTASQNDPDDFTTLWTETLATTTPQNELQLRTLDLSDYAGMDVYIAFRHHDVTDMDRLLLDDVMVEVKTAQDPLRDLTLNVRMRVWADEFEIFDPANDFVDVAGTFNDWGNEPLVLTALNDADLTYTITIPDLELGETYMFKFRINGSWSDETAEFPSGGPDREVTIADTGNEHTFWYNDDLPSAVNQLSEVQLNIFPNPARNFFTVQSSERINQMVISDITGRMISNIAVDAFETRIDLSGYKNGIYLIGVHTENGVSVSKLQIQK